MNETIRTFKFPNAIVRVHGEVNLERVKKATVRFLTAVEIEKQNRTKVSNYETSNF